MLSVRRNIHPIKPCLFGRLGVVKKQQIGGDCGVRAEHRAGQPDNRVQIELGNELLLDVHLGIVQTEQETVRHDNSSPAVLLQAVHDNRKKEVRSLGACQIVREEALNGLVLMPAVGRIHQDHIKLVLVRVVQQIVFQRVHVVDIRNLNVMQQHIGHAQQIGKGLLLNAINAVIKLLLRGGVRYLPRELPQPRSDKSTGAAGEVCHLFAQLRLYHQCHKLGDGSRRIKLTGRTGRLQLPQNLLIDKAKSVAFLHIVKCNLVNDINDLTKINAVLHIVVGVLKGGFDNGFLNWRIGCHLDPLIENHIPVLHIIAFQHREQNVVDEVQQLVPRHGVTVAVGFRPISPSQCFGNDGFVVVLVQRPIIFLCVIDFQEEHPHHLLNSLGVTIDPCVHTHNISDAFYKS